MRVAQKASINFDALRDYFFTPLGRQGGEGSTVAGILREQGFLNDTQLADLNNLLRQGRRIEQALASSGTDAELRAALQEVSPLTLSMVGRFIGAAEGARISRAMGRGGTIQIPATLQIWARVLQSASQQPLCRTFLCVSWTMPNLQRLHCAVRQSCRGPLPTKRFVAGSA
jgi:hypothetical protein